MWAIQKFEEFLRGLPFQAETDHLPLVLLFGRLDLHSVQRVVRPRQAAGHTRHIVLCPCGVWLMLLVLWTQLKHLPPSSCKFQQHCSLKGTRSGWGVQCPNFSVRVVSQAKKLPLHFMKYGAFIDELCLQWPFQRHSYGGASRLTSTGVDTDS